MVDTNMWSRLRGGLQVQEYDTKENNFFSFFKKNYWTGR
jgi:hypothetical protein